MQVRSLLIVMMNITFNLNAAARFFIVPYTRIAVKISIRFFIVVFAHDFVKNGQFEVRLFYQIYWLAWMARVGKHATLNAKKTAIKRGKNANQSFCAIND